MSHATDPVKPTQARLKPGQFRPGKTAREKARRKGSAEEIKQITAKSAPSMQRLAKA